MNASGPFEVEMTPEPPFSNQDGVTLMRMQVSKKFSGQLKGKSVVWMLAARTPVPTSAGYVALERVEAALGDRTGTFVLQHSGIMDGDEQSLTVKVVPGSGTAGLEGITGTMVIDIEDGQHAYSFEYELP